MAEPATVERNERLKREVLRNLTTVLATVDDSYGRGLATLMIGSTYGEGRKLELEGEMDDRERATRDAAEALGLGLEFSQREGVTAFGPAGRERSRHLVIELRKPDQLRAALARLQPTDFPEGRLTGQLGQLAYQIGEQIVGEYQAVRLDEDGGRHFLEEVAKAEPVGTELRRLVQNDGVNYLQHVIDYAQLRCLREFLALNKAHCLREPVGKYFGPGKWYTDNTPDTYARYWDEAIKAVEVARANPTAAALAQLAVDNLVHCVRLEIATMRSYVPDSKVDYAVRTRERYDELLPVALAKEELLVRLKAELQAALDSSSS